ncbi:MAG: T9SS type A sorting domain-containing protein [Cytophagales bacterium]
MLRNLLLKVSNSHYLKIVLSLIFIYSLGNSTKAQTISSFPYIEDFENGNGGWTTGGSGTWSLGTPTKQVINSAASGANCFVTGSLGGQYGSNVNSFVESPEFDFTSLQQPVIQMNVWWNSEFSWDGAVLQSSINNGSSWQNIGNLNDPNNWYNDNTINGNPGGQQIGWTGRNSTGNGSGGWVLAKNGMNSLVGQNSVKLRVAFGSDGSVQDEGFAFDDILIFDLKALDIGLLNVSSPIQDCGLGLEDVTVRIRNFGFQSQSNFNISYQLNNQAIVTETYNGSLNQDQEATYTFAQQVDLSSSDNYVISVWTDLTGDENRTNDSTLNIGLKTILPIAPVTFPGYTGDNLDEAVPGWSEARGQNPSGANSNWTSADSIQLQFFGVNTARVNLSGINQREWLIGPIFRVPQASIMYFNAATTIKDGTANSAMGSDDKLEVMLSNDCGTSWTSMLTLDASTGLDNSLRQYALRLDNYIGQEIILAFKASDGPSNDPEDYDLHVSNFEARFIYPNDAGIVSFRTDNGTQTINANSGTNVYIRLKNFGANTINTIPIIAKMGSVNYQFVRYNNLGPNQEVEINLGGYYASVQGPPQVPFLAYTMYPNDTINQNDTLRTFLNVTGAIGVGLDDQQNKPVKIYPNPSSDGVFLLHSETMLEGTITVYDSKGQKVHEQESNDNKLKINLSFFDKGIYILNYKSEGINSSYKLIYR